MNIFWIFLYFVQRGGVMDLYFKWVSGSSMKFRISKINKINSNSLKWQSGGEGFSLDQ
jgi:hypothetical protein